MLIDIYWFVVDVGATLELTYLMLADGYAQDDGGWGEDVKGGAIIVSSDSTLVLINCIVHSCSALTQSYVGRMCARRAPGA